jgi:hypothetical protein
VIPNRVPALVIFVTLLFSITATTTPAVGNSYTNATGLHGLVVLTGSAYFEG